MTDSHNTSAKPPYAYDDVYEGHVIFKEPVPEPLRAQIQREFLEECEAELTWLNDRHLVHDFMLMAASDFTDEEDDINTFPELLYHLDRYTNLPDYVHDVDLTPSSSREGPQPKGYDAQTPPEWF